MVTLRTEAGGTSITTESRLAPPLNITVRKAEFRYRQDWSPVSFILDATANGAEILLRTTFSDTTASTEGTQAGRPITGAHTVAPQTLIHANPVFASYIALARRLADLSLGAEFRVYVVPQAEISARVGAVHQERMQIGTEFLDVRRYDLIYNNPSGDVAASLTTDESGNLIRFSVPAQALDVVREDIASSTSRTQVSSNPGDEAVIVPAAGFNLGATLTRPAPDAGSPAPRRLPAVVLLSGSGVGDRDGFALGIPILAQLAGAIADAGMLAVRYDKRGNGQSGGRSESATLTDYAEDARTVVRWLERRRDVDPKRIALVGHSEGAWVALLAASRERRRVSAVVSIAGPATTGAELVLEQQRYALDRLDLDPDERQRRIAMQKQIQTAVLTGRGWDGVPAGLRAEADTPWFQSLLAYDPAEVIDDVRQPILFVHGALDRQVPVAHGERLAELARTEGRSKSIELVVVRGVNHLLVPASTGEVGEYGTLTDRQVGSDVRMAISTWLSRTFAAIR
jgi:pimeloyl-ACP methyl ester carboxylesterase